MIRLGHGSVIASLIYLTSDKDDFEARWLTSDSIPNHYVYVITYALDQSSFSWPMLVKREPGVYTLCRLVVWLLSSYCEEHYFSSDKQACLKKSLNIRSWPEAVSDTIHIMRPLIVSVEFWYTVPSCIIQFIWMFYGHLWASSDPGVTGPRNMHYFNARALIFIGPFWCWNQNSLVKLG